MQTVTLLGDMGEKFGSSWTMNVDYVRDIFKLIDCQRSGFREYLRECHENGIALEIRRGDDFLEKEEELLLSVGKEDFIITPVPIGSKSGVGKIIVAAILVVISIFFPPASAALSSFLSATAMSLAIAGITQLLMPGPETDNVDPDSYIFSGAQMGIKEGLPVPLLYGELIVGGGIINQSFTSGTIQSGDMKLAPNPEQNAGDWDTSEPDDEVAS